LKSIRLVTKGMWGTPCGIWPQQVVRVRFSYLEEEGKAIKEAEGLHLGPLSSRDG
jgi:hypothetical protein